MVQWPKETKQKIGKIDNKIIFRAYTVVRCDVFVHCQAVPRAWGN